MERQALMTFVLGALIAIATGVAVLRAASRALGWSDFGWAAAARASFVAQALSAVIGVLIGFIFGNSAISFAVAGALCIFVQAAVFQVSVRANGARLAQSTAYILAFLNLIFSAMAIVLAFGVTAGSREAS